MKVLIVTPRICPSRFNYYYQLGKLCKLTVISELTPESSDFEEALSSSTIPFKLIYLNGIVVKDYLSISFKVLKYLRKCINSTVVIEQYSSPTSMIAIVYLKLKKKPFFLNADGGFIKHHESRIKRFIKRFFLSSANYYLVSSNFASKYLVFYGANPKNIYQFPISSSAYIKPLSVFKSKKESDLFRTKLFNNNYPIVTYVGRFVYEKGFDLFLNLVQSEQVVANFLMIGGRLEISDDISNHNKNLKVIDNVSSDDVKKYLYISDLHVIPSRNDVWNYTLVEAYNMGTRVVASSGTGAAVELLYNKDKFMFKINDFDEFIQSVKNGLETEKTNQESSYYLQMSMKYTSGNMAKSIHNILSLVDRDTNEIN